MFADVPAAKRRYKSPGRRAIAEACAGVLMPSNGVTYTDDGKVPAPWSKTHRRAEILAFFASARPAWRPVRKEKVQP